MKQKQDTNSERKYALKMPPNWEPPFPSFESDLGDVDNVCMAVIGCQFSSENRVQAFECVNAFAALARSEGSNHDDLAEVTSDSAGLSQIFATVYWLKTESMSDYFDGDRFKALWARNSAMDANFGLFREIFNTPAERFETLHSGPEHIVGVANAREGVSEPMQTHAYWGSMRDRIPDAAQDQFVVDEDVKVEVLGEKHVRIHVNHNFAVIRSGQDLTNAEGTEYTEYFRDVEPALRTGMNFLRDQGGEVGCKDCRYASLLSDDGVPTKHTFGLAYFRSLDQLEDWAENHPTHLAIFNSFLEFAPRYGPAMKSRYWHEVSVLPSEGQYAEYINCAPNTGLMTAI